VRRDVVTALLVLALALGVVLVVAGVVARLFLH
jgi:hypothetical protein